MEEITLTADDHVAEAGRLMMEQQLATIIYLEESVRTTADMLAVHGMRKAIRRTLTCFKLFGPYFDPGTLKSYRRGLRGIMNRLAASRDMAVFGMKLAAYNQAAEWPLDDLAHEWENWQKAVDEKTMRYLAKPKQQAFLGQYQAFVGTPGEGVMHHSNKWVPVKLRHHIPILVFRRIAAVRAIGDQMQSATVKQLHQLRIQFKDLRYSLQFFAPLLGEELEIMLIDLEQSQEILGNLNDTTVALQLLSETVGLDASVARYTAYQAQEQEHLVASYLPVWQEFDRPGWRRSMAGIVASL